MAYSKINWQNDVTPINEINLNHMDNQIAANADMLEQVTEEVSNRLPADSDKIIQDTNGQPQGAGVLICRENGQLKMYRNVTETPVNGDSAQEYLSPVKCTYSTEQELVAAIEEHGLTDESSTSTTSPCIRMFDLYTPDDTFVDTVCIYSALSTYYIGSATGLITVRSGVTAADWADGTGDLYSKYTAKGYTELVLKNISDFAEQSMSETAVSYSPFATWEDLQQRLAVSDPEFEGTLGTERTDTSDTSELINFSISTADGVKTFTVRPVLSNGQIARVEIGGTIPVVFGSTVAGTIYVYNSVLSDSGHTGDSSSHLVFNDDTLSGILNSSSAPPVIKITVDSELFGDSSQFRDFVMTRQFDGLYIQTCLNNGTMYRVILSPQVLEMWYEQM